MQEQLEQLKINSESINSVFSRSRSNLRKIKIERKRFNAQQIQEKKIKNKKKKLKINKSPFGKSLKKIKRSTSTSALFKNLGGDILKFVSILLLGTALNNIDAIKKAFSKTKNFIIETFDSIGDFIENIKDKADKFTTLFDSEKDIDKKIVEFESEIEEIERNGKNFKEKAEDLGLLYDKEFEKSISERFGSADLSKVDLSLQDTITPFDPGQFDMFGRLKSNQTLENQGFSLEPLDITKFRKNVGQNFFRGLSELIEGAPLNKDEDIILRLLKEANGDLNRIDFQNLKLKDPPPINLDLNKNNNSTKVLIQPVIVDPD